MAKLRYTKDINEKAYKLSLLGLTDEEMCTFFDISWQTWFNWQNRFPKLKEAIQKGKTDADSEVAYTVYRKATGTFFHDDVHILSNRVNEYDDEGKIVRSYTEPLIVPIIKHYPPDTACALFWLKNRSKRRKDPWLEIQRTEVTGKGGGPIKTQNMNFDQEIPLDDLTDEELKMLKRIGVKAIKEEEEK